MPLFQTFVIYITPESLRQMANDLEFRIKAGEEAPAIQLKEDASPLVSIELVYDPNISNVEYIESDLERQIRQAVAAAQAMRDESEALVEQANAVRDQEESV